MKRVESFARISVFVFLLVLALSGIIMVKEYVGWATYLESEGGAIYEVIIDLKRPAFLWTGVYGVAVRVIGYTNGIDYELTGGETLEANLLFDCLEPNIQHEVYASTVDPSLIDFNSLGPADASDVDDFLGMGSFDALIQYMSGTRTFNKNISVELGADNYTIPGTYTFRQGESIPATFDVGVMKDANGVLVFVSNINTNFTSGFNGRIFNYQMILPIRNNTNEDKYYFFSDPFDICPQGEGELPNAGTVAGYVTTESGIPISNTLIDIGGYTALSQSNGYYNVSAPEGIYRIYAIKTGYAVYTSNVTVVANETTIHNIILVIQSDSTFTNVGPGVDDGPGEDDPGEDVGPGEAPAVPIVEQPKRIEGTDYIISLNAINRKLKLGEFLQEEVKVFSFRESTTEVYFEITGDLLDLVNLDKDNLLIAPNTKDQATLTIYGRGDPGLYNGSIEISGDFNASIPISIELMNKDQIPVQALLVELETSREEINPGDQIRIKTDLKNLLSDQEYPVTLFYTIQDESGNKTYWTHSTNVFLRTSMSLLKTFEAPKDMPEGTYIVRVTSDYLGFSSGTSTVFSVKTPLLYRLLFGLFIWQWLLILLGLILLTVAGFVIRRRIEAKKRFHMKVEYSQLPKPGPRSGWWGKIAETDHKTYFDLEQLKIHTIVAGSTGGGKSISAQVIIEECLLKDVAIICFDPTAQWSGMLRPCKEKGMLKYYPGFNMNPKQAKAFNGNVRLVTNPREVVEIKKFMKPGEIQIFAMNKLNPKDIDIFVANTIRQVFSENFSENPELRLMLVYDEIHRILPKFGGSGDGFVQIERGCREFRKWGLGIMLVSQVLADFVGQIKANINTEVQMRTRDEGDLERIKTKYGDSVLKSLVKASVGSGMVQNAAYNRGKPYFVTFRPILHSVQRLTDEELETYNKYNEEIDQMEYELEQLEKLELDVFDMKLELKLSLDKVKFGNFNMVEVYLEGIRPRIKKEWEKLGKIPKKKEIKTVSEEDLKSAVKAAQASREDYAAKESASKGPEVKTAEDFYQKEVSPDHILNLANGMLVLSMKGLYDELAAMKQSDFDQHVNEDKNEFADWIKDAVGDQELAQRLSLTKDKKEIMDFIDLRKNKKKLPDLSPDQKKVLEAQKWFEPSQEVPKSEEKKEPVINEETVPETKVEDSKIVSSIPVEEKSTEGSVEGSVEKQGVQSQTDNNWSKEDINAEAPVTQEQSVVKEPEPILSSQITPDAINQKPLEETVAEDKVLETNNVDVSLENSVHSIEASPDQYFKLSNGVEIKSVLDLVDNLRAMNYDDFRNYVNGEKNDFASWIRGVFNDDELANKIQSITEKEAMIDALQEG